MKLGGYFSSHSNIYLNYEPPELETGDVDETTDIYELGMAMLLFATNRNLDTKRKHISKELLHILKRCISNKKENRITLEELVDFFNNYDIKLLKLIFILYKEKSKTKIIDELLNIISKDRNKINKLANRYIIIGLIKICLKVNNIINFYKIAGILYMIFENSIILL